MARKRTIDRIGQRGEFDEEEEKETEEEEADEEEETDEDEDAEAEADDEAGEEEEEEKPKPVKKPKKKAATPRKPRAAKVVRQKAIWVIFDNSSKQIETFPYSQKAEAERFLAEKNTDKKGYYIQMIKVPLDEKEK